MSYVPVTAALGAAARGVTPACEYASKPNKTKNKISIHVMLAASLAIAWN